MYRIGWFSTGRDAAARELLSTVWETIERGGLEARLEFVFSNREPGESEESDAFFSLVRSYHLPLISLSSRSFGAVPHRRLEYDRQVMQRLEGFSPHLSVLAGYMLIVGDEMCQRYDLINLHPAAPGGPAGTWQEVIWQLMEAQAESTGVMMHLVTPELDQGPPATYSTFPIRGQPFDPLWKEIEGRPVSEIKAREGGANPLFRLIRQEGVRRELPLIVATLRAFAEGRVRIESKRVVDGSGRPVAGYDLTPEIERAVGR